MFHLKTYNIIKVEKKLIIQKSDVYTSHLFFSMHNRIFLFLLYEAPYHKHAKLIHILFLKIIVMASKGRSHKDSI